MSKKILVVACLVMMATVFTGCDLLGGDKNKEGTKEGTGIEQNQESNGDGNYFETMKDLMARGKSMKCTYTQKIDDGGTASGVIYMADKNARTEITVSEKAGHTAKMYAIINKDWVYSWTEGSSTGFKMTTEASELSEKQEETVTDLSKEIDFECKSWKKDSSKFKTPSNVKFDDMSEMIKNLGDVNFEEEAKNAEDEGNKFICELCKMVPAEEQAECLGDVVCDWSK